VRRADLIRKRLFGGKLEGRRGLTKRSILGDPAGGVWLHKVGE
jgi:hypothetical protein